ncbi:MAG: hypothetical protein HZA46_16445 [Planctomycetales bacterium]|nr:hypothetical protein [Planctomycetales bacterium]
MINRFDFEINGPAVDSGPGCFTHCEERPNGDLVPSLDVRHVDFRIRGKSIGVESWLLGMFSAENVETVLSQFVEEGFKVLRVEFHGQRRSFLLIGQSEVSRAPGATSLIAMTLSSSCCPPAIQIIWVFGVRPKLDVSTFPPRIHRSRRGCGETTKWATVTRMHQVID